MFKVKMQVEEKVIKTVSKMIYKSNNNRDQLIYLTKKATFQIIEVIECKKQLMIRGRDGKHSQ